MKNISEAINGIYSKVIKYEFHTKRGLPIWINQGGNCFYAPEYKSCIQLANGEYAIEINAGKWFVTNDVSSTFKINLKELSLSEDDFFDSYQSILEWEKLNKRKS